VRPDQLHLPVLQTDARHAVLVRLDVTYAHMHTYTNTHST
jgi:hypothetical protein